MSLLILAVIGLAALSKALSFSNIYPSNEYEPNTQIFLKGVESSCVNELAFRTLYCSDPRGPVKLGDTAWSSRELMRRGNVVVTPHKVHAGRDAECLKLCERNIPKDQLGDLVRGIEENVTIDLVLDGLSLVTVTTHPTTRILQYQTGVRLGYKEQGKYYLHNHIDLFIQYRRSSIEDGGRIEVLSFLGVARNIHPQGLQVRSKGCVENVLQMRGAHLPVNPPSDVALTVTYSITWEGAEPGATSWDYYLKVGEVDCAAVFIWLGAVLLVSVSLLCRARRTHRLCSSVSVSALVRCRPSSPLLQEQPVHGGAPGLVHPMVFTVLVGSGLHLALIAAIMLSGCQVTLWSSTHGEAIQIPAIISAGLAAGYQTGRIYRLVGGAWGGARCMLTAALMAFLYPAGGVCVEVLLNVAMLPVYYLFPLSFDHLSLLVLQWCGLSLLPIACGLSCGYHRQPQDPPSQPHTPTKQGHLKEKWKSPVFVSLLTGFLLFVAILLPLNAVVRSVLTGHYLFVLEVLLGTLVTLVTLASCLPPIMSVWLHGGNPLWLWLSFHSTASCAFYIFVYSFIHYLVYFGITGFTPLVFYTGRLLVVCFGVWLIAGSFGSFLWLCRR